MESYTPSPALRVSQLDANEIDVELCEIVLNQYKRVLSCLSVSDLSKFDAEARTIFKFLFWWCSIKNENCTLGQQMMDMSYGGFENSPIRKTFHLVITVVVPYIRERLSDIIGVFAGEATSDFVGRKVFDRLDLFIELINVCHFLLFLNVGGFRNITERILNIKSIHNIRPVLGEIDYSVMNRELIWHGFADLLLFVLPLLKFRRIWNFFKEKLFFRRTKQLSDDDNFESSMFVSKDFVASCAVCRDYPIIPCHFGCGHAFCYYCLKANIDENESFACPDCFSSAKNRKFKFVNLAKKLHRNNIE